MTLAEINRTTAPYRRLIESKTKTSFSGLVIIGRMSHSMINSDWAIIVQVPDISIMDDRTHSILVMLVASSGLSIDMNMSRNTFLKPQFNSLINLSCLFEKRLISN